MARPGLTPRRLTADDLTVADALDLMRAAFAYMDGRIEPPSSIHRLDLGALRTACTEAEPSVLSGAIAPGDRAYSRISSSWTEIAEL